MASQPTEQQLRYAFLRGQEAGDLRNASALDNPYDAAQHRALHDSWEEGRRDGVRNH